MRIETIDGVTLAYQESGCGETIVLIHGLGASSYSWREIADRFAGSHRVVSVDLMGFGYSEKPRQESYTLERQAFLVKQFLARKGLVSPILMGHSYGGGVCLSLMEQARRDSQLQISGLVLVDSVCYPQQFPFFFKVLRSPILRALAFKLVPPRLSVTQMLNLVYYRRERIKPETVDEYTRLLSSEGARDALARTAECILPADIGQFTGSYRAISAPTLVLWGEHDRIIPITLGKRLSSEIPNARFHVIQDCGHAPQEELPEETASLIARFLESPQG